ncbi:hypothetical protein [Flavobacterium sp.]|uniref:hypothetical protein n=1 Tax=Flavobacterium sp. TaxID=239 RepID=UPI003B9928AE
MNVLVDKSSSEELAKLLIDKLKESPKKGKLVKHFGKLKRNIDGLKYQLATRSAEA